MNNYLNLMPLSYAFQFWFIKITRMSGIIKSLVTSIAIKFYFNANFYHIIFLFLSVIIFFSLYNEVVFTFDGIFENRYGIFKMCLKLFYISIYETFFQI